MNLLINFDHGVMPAGAPSMQAELGLNNSEYGWLGSVVFIGLTLGSISASFMYEKFNSKNVLLAVLLANAVSMSIFTTSANFVVLMTSRFFTGFFQVFVSIYYPVWADSFGSSDQQKTTWMSVLLFSSSFGVLIGYAVTGQLIQSVSWRWAFYLQIAATVPICTVLLLTPSAYLDLKAAAQGDHEAVVDSGADSGQKPATRLEDARSNSKTSGSPFRTSPSEDNDRQSTQTDQFLSDMRRDDMVSVHQFNESLNRSSRTPSVVRRRISNRMSWNQGFGHQTDIFIRSSPQRSNDLVVGKARRHSKSFHPN